MNRLDLWDPPSVAQPTLRGPPPLLTPTTSSTPLKLCAQSAFSPPSSTTPTPYVLFIVPLSSSHYLIAASSDEIKILSDKLELVMVLPGKQKGLTSLKKGSEGSGMCWSTARDGTVVGWNENDMNKEAIRFKAKSGAPYLTSSQSSDHTLLAVGTELFHHESSIDLYSLTTSTLLWSYIDSHSDDLTSLSFHPSISTPYILLSSSVDGLMNLYDTRIEEEDDALVSTAQVGASLLDCGWMELEAKDGRLKGVWGSTTIETIQFWDLEESNLLADLGDIRDVCLEPWRSDYLIGAHYNVSLGGVCIFTGTQKGDIAIINLSSPKHWILEQVLPGVGGRTLGGAGHSDIVRCAYLDPKTSKVITGGEDGMVCLWSL